MNLHLNILNFITDDKFLDAVISNHDLVEDNVTHYYVLVLDNHENKDKYLFKHIKQHYRVNLIYKNEILKYIENFDINAIIIHSLNSIPLDILFVIKQNIPILWNAWGFDIYELPYLDPFIPIKDIYKPLTQKILAKIAQKRRKTLINVFAKIRDSLVKNKIYTPQKTKYAKLCLKRVDFFSGVIDIEYSMMKNQPKFIANEAIYSYQSLNHNDPVSLAKGNNILLGNSGNDTNNHPDILYLLNEIGLDNSNIICPLNYGKDKNYIEKVIKIGSNLFKEKFQPLTEFLRIDKYLKIINTCSTVIIGSMRQQAMGNISIAIYMGCKIFFYKDSILYEYFKNKGYIVFSIEDELTKESIKRPLTREEIEYNIRLNDELSSKRWNTDAIKKLYSQFRHHCLLHKE